jgi:hypothetical protein
MRSHNSSGTSQIVGSGFFFFISYPLLALKLYAFKRF